MESTQGVRSQGVRFDVVLAASVAFATTTGMFIGLAVLMRPAFVRTPPSYTHIDVVWLRPAPAPLRVPPRGRRHERPRAAMRAPLPFDPAPSPSDAVSDAPPVAPGRSLSAIYLDQMRTTAEPAVATADPLADRHARLPGEGAGRFRMRRPTSVASVVNGIGRMLGGRDPDEPCRENRRNIGELALDGDNAALRQQLEYEHRLCRP